MELSKKGIAVAQYWTELPPKAEFERKIKPNFPKELYIGCKNS